MFTGEKRAMVWSSRKNGREKASKDVAKDRVNFFELFSKSYD